MRKLLRVLGWLNFIGAVIAAVILLILRDATEDAARNGSTYALRELAAYPTTTTLLVAVAAAFLFSSLCWGLAHVIGQNDRIEAQLARLSAAPESGAAPEQAQQPAVS